MEQTKRILTVQDISCVGQCSLTVALPILSACGVETAILPSAVLSTHTDGFTGYTFRDLTGDMPGIVDHWVKEGLDFDAVYTGYLGSAEQIAIVKDIFCRVLKPGGLKIVDPAMADNGKLYPGFDAAFAGEMATLCGAADIVLPNVTEACLMTGAPYRETYDAAYANDLADRLLALGAGNVVLTGIGYTPESTGVLVVRGSERSYYAHPRISGGYHGTGDVYASAFTGALLAGQSMERAAKTAADFTCAAIRNTVGDTAHFYGVHFERALKGLMQALEETEKI